MNTYLNSLNTFESTLVNVKGSGNVIRHVPDVDDVPLIFTCGSYSLKCAVLVALLYLI